jgi:hypothetical protein
MEAAENYKLIKEEEKIVLELSEKIKEINKELTKLKITRQEHYENIYNLKNGKGKIERKNFIMPCPHNGCKGFLSQQYKCEICKLYTCPNCYEVIGYNKTDEHECKKESVESAELIRKDTKPCPNCGVRIFKISGCDQMWCTECETTFSWNTGRLLVNVQVHNPHFYARQREIQNGNMNRDPRDVLCGGVCTFQQLRRFIVLYINSNEPLFNEITKLTAGDINEWHRFVTHITNVELFLTRQRLQQLRNNQGILIEYIVNERTKESLATQIIRNDKNSKKLVELVNIYELLSVFGIESFGYLTNGDFKGKKAKDIFEIVIKQYNEYQKLIAYCNEQLKIISLTYNCQVLQVLNNVPRAQVASKQELAKGYDFKIESKKFTLKDITAKSGKDEGSCSYH